MQPPPATFAELIDDVLSRHNPSEALTSALSQVRDALTRDAGDSTFLSVILRTQGKRPQTLRDMLLCLASQSDNDYHLIVAIHDASPEETATTAAILNDYRPLLPPGVTSISVSGGTRARPLNAVLPHIRGKYVAFVDDDDLLFGHWVETFKSQATLSAGRMLRATAGVQRIAATAWPGKHDGFRTCSWPAAEYERTFDLARHLEKNRSPFMTVAFPAQLFSVVGVSFDEDLEVCEDWDVIVQASMLCGVENAEAMTSVYRRWTSGESSYDVHSSQEWVRSEQRLRAKFNRIPLLMQAGSAERLALLAQKEVTASSLEHITMSRAWRASAGVRAIADRLRHLRSRIRNRLNRLRR